MASQGGMTRLFFRSAAPLDSAIGVAWLQVRQVEDLQAEVLEVAVAVGLLDGRVKGRGCVSYDNLYFCCGDWGCFGSVRSIKPRVSIGER